MLARLADASTMAPLTSRCLPGFWSQIGPKFSANSSLETTDGRTCHWDFPCQTDGAANHRKYALEKTLPCTREVYRAGLLARSLGPRVANRPPMIPNGTAALKTTPSRFQSGGSKDLFALFSPLVLRYLIMSNLLCRIRCVRFRPP